MGSGQIPLAVVGGTEKNYITMTNQPAIGIDLGTTFSVVARLNESGTPDTIVNAEGRRITPSVVLFDGEDVVVG